MLSLSVLLSTGSRQQNLIHTACRRGYKYLSAAATLYKEAIALKVKDLLEQLTEFDPDSEVAIYDDDNDRMLDVSCRDNDDADDSNPPRVLIFC